MNGMGADDRRVRVSLCLDESACFNRADSWRTVIFPANEIEISRLNSFSSYTFVPQANIKSLT